MTTTTDKTISPAWDHEFPLEGVTRDEVTTLTLNPEERTLWMWRRDRDDNSTPEGLYFRRELEILTIARGTDLSTAVAWIDTRHEDIQRLASAHLPNVTEHPEGHVPVEERVHFLIHRFQDDYDDAVHEGTILVYDDATPFLEDHEDEVLDLVQTLGSQEAAIEEVVANWGDGESRYNAFNVGLVISGIVERHLVSA